MGWGGGAGGSPQDERPEGWVEKGTKLILKRGHVSRSQSNTLAEVKRTSGLVERPPSFLLDNRAVLRARDPGIHGTRMPGPRAIEGRSAILKFVALRL